MTDKDTADAIAALASRIRVRDKAIRDGDDDLADAELFAAEFLTALRGRGWRVTEAKPMPTWKSGSSASGGLPQEPDVAALVREKRAEVDAKAAAFREKAARSDEGSAA